MIRMQLRTYVSICSLITVMFWAATGALLHGRRTLLTCPARRAVPRLCLRAGTIILVIDRLVPFILRCCPAQPCSLLLFGGVPDAGHIPLLRCFLCAARYARLQVLTCCTAAHCAYVCAAACLLCSVTMEDPGVDRTLIRFVRWISTHYNCFGPTHTRSAHACCPTLAPRTMLLRTNSLFTFHSLHIQSLDWYVGWYYSFALAAPYHTTGYGWTTVFYTHYTIRRSTWTRFTRYGTLYTVDDELDVPSWSRSWMGVHVVLRYVTHDVGFPATFCSPFYTP